jgi:hypothetical protein
MTEQVSEADDFDWDDVNAVQQNPVIVAIADKLMDLYGEVDVYADDRDLYSDASVIFHVAEAAR